MLDHVFLSVSDIERSIAFIRRRWRRSESLTASILTARTARRGIPISRASAAKGDLSFGCGQALPIAGRRISASSQNHGARSTQPLPPPSRRARPTMANQVLGSITIRVTMPPTCSTPTATASSLFSRAGSTPSPNRQPCTSGPLWSKANFFDLQTDVCQVPRADIKPLAIGPGRTPKTIHWSGRNLPKVG